jgi:hypothetical protein
MVLALLFDVQRVRRVTWIVREASVERRTSCMAFPTLEQPIRSIEANRFRKAAPPQLERNGNAC